MRLCTNVSALLIAVTSFLLPCVRDTSVSAAVSDSPDAHFERLGPFGGEVRSLLISPHDSSRVYLGTSDGQLFESGDGGHSWAPIFPGLDRREFVVDTLVAHPTESDHIYAGGWDLRSDGGALLQSTDGGGSWNAVKLPQGAAAVRDFAICRKDPRYQIVGTLRGAFVTSDGGIRWHRVLGGTGGVQNIESVAIDPQDPRHLFVGTWRLSYRSSDSGRTWTRAERGMPLDSDVFSIDVDPRNPDVVYAGACSGVYRSSNRAASWTRLRLLPDRFTVRSHQVSIDPVDPHRVYVGTTEGLFVSNDDGQKWKRVTASDLTVNAIQVDPRDNRKVLLGTGGEGVLRSEDGGSTWKESNAGFIHRQISRILPDRDVSRHIYTGIVSDGSRGGYFEFDEKDRRWTPVTAGLAAETELRSFLSLPGKSWRLAGTGRGAYLQRSPTSAWAPMAGPIGKLPVNDFAYDPAATWIYAATDEGVYRARPDELFFRGAVASPLRPRVWALAVSHSSPAVIYGASSLGVIRSRDQGMLWEVVSYGLPARARIECLAISPAEKGHLLAGTVAGLYETRDEGWNWQRASDPRLGVDVPSVIFLGPGGKSIMAADNTNGGVFLSSDGGLRWNRIESALYASPVRYLAQDPECNSRVYVGTSSEGVYLLQLKEAATRQGGEGPRDSTPKKSGSSTR